MGRADGPYLEPYLSLAAVASVTGRMTLGTLVTPITFRNPAHLAKMATTLDHISHGRAVLGLGAGWFELEHRQYGFPFGGGFGERLDWLEEALPIVRAMLDGDRPTFDGAHTKVEAAENEPRPLQERLPILVGGSGPRRTLRMVAEHADMWNVIGPPDGVAQRDGVLREHCEAVGRDHTEIERTLAVRQPVIRDTAAAAQSALDEILAGHDGGPWPDHPMAGTVDSVAEQLAEYLDVGFRHFIFQFLHPFDDETATRLVAEVRPVLSRA
jgi:alkanesulfonate monooxygenase SsuD/methylene tetrahydromethanopterin reductase-like flavin-dependent oxidoreductase (luciferase family)